MKNLITILFCVLVALLTGCASITGTKNQPVSVDTFYHNQEVAGCDCKLANDKGVWYAKTPGSVLIQKSYENLVITCTKDSIDTGSAIFESKTEGAVWGNIIAGGGIGYIIDRSSGAGFAYPTSMNVEMGVLNKHVESPKQEQAASSVGVSQLSDSTSKTTNSTTVAQTSNATSQTGNTTTDKLRQLQALKNDGVISEEDYQKQKQKLLDQM